MIFTDENFELIDEEIIGVLDGWIRGAAPLSPPPPPIFFEWLFSGKIYTGWPKKNGTVDFLGLYSDQQLSLFTLLDGASFSHYNNTKIIKFGWELFILWEITDGLSFSGFAIDLSLIVPRNSGNRANPENDSPQEITHKIKSSQPNLMILVLL